MINLSRRHFVQTASGLLLLSQSPLSLSAKKNSGEIVIIGGGVGGATAARYIKLSDPSIKVTIIEPNANYYTCFMSNEVISGQRTMESIKFSYQHLIAMGINIIQDFAQVIDTEKKQVITKNHGKMSYDRCIVAPGIDFRWSLIEGYNEQLAATQFPHAWQAGQQTIRLKHQLEAMKDGGLVIISAPKNPYRCPPGPYERASQIAYYLKQHKPKSKILILDAKENFSKQELFIQAWKKYYGYGTNKSLIEWVKGSEGGIVEALHAKTRTLVGAVDDHIGDVLNIIPEQKAGKIAQLSGLVNKQGWCPIDQQTFASSLAKDIYVIGDSSMASPLPKSAFSANNEAKVCARAIVASLHNKPINPNPIFINTCYSVITPEDAVSIAMVYKYSGTKIEKIKGSGGSTALDSTANMRKREVNYAHSWFNNISHDIFGG